MTEQEIVEFGRNFKRIQREYRRYADEVKLVLIAKGAAMYETDYHRDGYVIGANVAEVVVEYPNEDGLPVERQIPFEAFDDFKYKSCALETAKRIIEIEKQNEISRLVGMRDEVEMELNRVTDRLSEIDERLSKL